MIKSLLYSLCKYNMVHKVTNTSIRYLKRTKGQETHPTSLSSMVPGWKGGKVLPLGGSLGEYSLNDLEEQPG